MSKWVPALSVTKNDEVWPIVVGTPIRLYGKETTVTGFEFHFNESLEKWETIILTTGRGDPLERSLDVIEIKVD